MKEIPLTRGLVSLVDDEDFEFLSKFSWHLSGTNSNRYATTSLTMHRLVMGLPSDEVVDHKDGNRLDNRKQNLRICSSSENSINRDGKTNGASPYKGVSKVRKSKTWAAYIKKNGIRYSLGSFLNQETAALVYDAAAVELYGDFARLNFPEKVGKSVHQIHQEERIRRGFTSRFIGVSKNGSFDKWVAEIWIKNKKHYLGSFDAEIDAAIAYDKEAIRHGYHVYQLNLPN